MTLTKRSVVSVILSIILGSEILNWLVYLNKSNFVKFKAMLNTLVIVVNTCRCELVTAFPGDVIEAFSRNL